MYLELAENDQLSAKLTKRQKWTRAMAFLPATAPIAIARALKDKKKREEAAKAQTNPMSFITAPAQKRSGESRKRAKVLLKSVENISPLSPEPSPEDMTTTILPDDNFAPAPEMDGMIPATNYLPNPENPEILVREDELDIMPDQQFEEYVGKHCPYLSEEQYEQLSGSRKQRKAEKHAAKMAKKAAKTDIKLAKAEKKRSGKGTTFSDVIGGIKDVAGSAIDVIGSVKGKGGAGAETDVAVEQSFFAKNKTLLIGGAAVILIGAFLLTKKSGKK